MTRLCFIDTETTSLRPDRRAWEIGVIVREPGEKDAEHLWFIDESDLDLGNADLMALKIGRFHDRHPGVKFRDNPGARIENGARLYPERFALLELEAITRGAHLAGNVVNFDADVLATRMRSHGICPSWHYHLIDVEALAVGYLTAYERAGTPLGKKTGLPYPELPLPWNSDDLSAALGVAVGRDERHTALGDARWARDMYDAVMGGAP